MVTRSLIIMLALVCAQVHAETFAAFVARYSLTGADALPGADPDHDGVSNLMEYALKDMDPTRCDVTSTSMPVMGYASRTGSGIGQWTWHDVPHNHSDALSGVYHLAMRWVTRPGVEGIRYVPEISDASSLKRWFSGRSAFYIESYIGGTLQATTLARANRYKRMFMRLSVQQDSTVDGSQGGVHVHAYALEQLVPGTATALPRAVTAPSTSDITVEDRLVHRTTGADTVTDYLWSWSPAATNVSPVVVERTSSAAGVLTPDASNPYRWTYQGAGAATLTLRTQTSSYTASVTTSTATGATVDVVTGYASGSLRKHCADTIDNALAGKSADTALAIFSTQDHTTPSYVRNTSCWGASFASALTAISPWNSQLGVYYSGVLVSPRHVIFATHFMPMPGAVLRFVTTGNVVVERTLSALTPLTQSQAYYPDIAVGLLDSDVPGTIAFARVLPSDWAAKLPSLSAANAVPCITTDQEEKLLVRELTIMPSSTTPYATVAMMMPADAQRRAFYEDVVGGDSGNPACLVVNGQLVLLTVWTSGGAGSGTSVYAFKSAINAAMTSLGGGYTLTDADLSGFNSY